ncbi:MAG: polysaccharide biosynthesis protein, partial [Betaproteobacteria bacterium]
MILLALNSTGRARRREIVAELEKYCLEIKTIPNLSGIINGSTQITDVRNVTAEDLLGREPISTDATLMVKNIRDRVVMVSGAGGSIGSELC